MVSQVNWEDDIIWSLDGVKPNLQAQARAGWIPTSTTRTAHAYALQQDQLLQQLGMISWIYDTMVAWKKSYCLYCMVERIWPLSLLDIHPDKILRRRTSKVYWEFGPKIMAIKVVEINALILIYDTEININKN